MCCSLSSVDDLQCFICLESLDLRSNQITGLLSLFEVYVLSDMTVSRGTDVQDGRPELYSILVLRCSSYSIIMPQSICLHWI